MAKSKQRRNEAAIAILASNIRKCRKEKGLTLQELANLLDVDYSQIGRMERGKVNFSVSILFDIATALNIAPSYLVGGKDIK